MIQLDGLSCKYIYVAASSQHVGKTTCTLGIVANLLAKEPKILYFRISYFHRLCRRDNSHAAVHRQLLPGPPLVWNSLARGGHAKLPAVRLLVPAVHLCLPGHEGHHGSRMGSRRETFSSARTHRKLRLDLDILVAQCHLLEDPAEIGVNQYFL